MTSRMGTPRVGDTVVLRMAGEAVQDVVTRVAVRQIRGGQYTSEWFAISTARFGFHGFRRRANYFIQD